ncbi:MAG: hypothetical protein AAGD12_08175 [Pseudomonadota bacterium]
MVFELSDLERIRRGGIKQVGQVPDAVVKAAGWRLPYVYVGPESLRHILDKHIDISEFDLLNIPIAIRDGLIVQETKKQNVIVIIYLPSAETGVRFACPIKPTANSTEIWVSSFYRVREKQVRRIKERGTILREHS